MKRTFTIVALTGLLAGAGLTQIAAAQAVTGASQGDQAEVAAFLKAPTDMTAALQAAETATGAKAVAAEFDQKGDRSFYEVDLVGNGRISSVEVDPATGVVKNTKDEGPLDAAATKDDDFVDPATLTLGLIDAVAKAEAQHQGSKVMAISAEGQEAGAETLEVELAQADGTTREFAMTADGKMVVVADDDDSKSEASENESDDADEQGEDND